MRLGAVVVAIVLCFAAVVYLLRDLPPPDRLVFAAGPRDGGYWKFATLYRDVLARDGIETEILETAGSVENLGLLATREADVALVQGGVPVPETGIEGLGTVFTEPVLIVVRRDGGVPRNPGEWRGLRVAVGEEGSGTRVVAESLFDALGIAAPVNALVALGGQAAAAALLEDDIDVAIFVAPIEADYLKGLIDIPEIELLRLDHIEAVSLRLPHSRVATVPSGAVTLVPPKPAQPFDLLALRARLAAADGLHPAIVDRLIVAAREIHGGRSLFAPEGAYPSAEGGGMPLDQGAQKLLTDGQSIFHTWLPFWIAAQIRQVLLVLLPILFVVVPLVRALPLAYGWTMRRRVWRHYRRLRTIERDLTTTDDPATLAALDRLLRDIDRRLAAMKLPPAFRGRAFDARLHVELVRRQIADRQAEIAAGDSAAVAADATP